MSDPPSDGFVEPTDEHVQRLFREGEIGRIDGQFTFVLGNFEQRVSARPLVGEHCTVYGLRVLFKELGRHHFEQVAFLGRGTRVVMQDAYAATLKALRGDKGGKR